MKKLACFLLLASIMLQVPVFADDSAQEEAAVILKYSSSYRSEQGVDGWYFCNFVGNDAYEMVYNGSAWKPADGSAYPSWGKDGGAITPGDNVDGGHKFVAPMRGMVRLRGAANLANANTLKGNGVIIKIYKGDQMLYKKQITYGTPADYDMIIPVTTGDELYFRVDANRANPFDWTIWWPTVEYLDMEYQGAEGEGAYCQKSLADGTVKELEYIDDIDGYLADDGIAFVSNRAVMPSRDYSIVKRWKSEEQGRYRVRGSIEATDDRGSGHIIKITRNGELLWEQMFPNGETGKFDIRMFNEANDIVELEIADLNYTGYNYANWSCEMGEYIGTVPFCNTTSSLGHKAVVKKEYTLGSLIGTVQDDEHGYYTEKDDVLIPMEYSSSDRQWKSTVSGSGGYISPTVIYQGRDTNAVVETTIPDSGVMRIFGDMKSDLGDGVVSKIYINDKLIWSSRVGGERSVRWDEPFDVSYFVNYVDVTSCVNAGDKLKLTFNQWRKADNDTVDISDVKINYISGDVLSETTKWKLNQSAIIDTVNKTVCLPGGEYVNSDVLMENDKTYISESAAKSIFSDECANCKDVMERNGVRYVSVRSAAEITDKSVAWAADRIVLVYDGIPLMYGYSEMSEIETTLKLGGDLID